MPQIGADARIRFLFRTHDGNGLLVYTARSGGNYLAVELVDGRLVAVSDDGSGPRYVRSEESLADGQWHEVGVAKLISLLVDGLLFYPFLLPPMVVCLKRGVNHLHLVQLMPLPSHHLLSE